MAEMVHSYLNRLAVTPVGLPPLSVSRSSDADSGACVMSVFFVSTQVDLTVQEKEKYLNVSRWFCHIQHCPGIRQHLSSVVFIKNRLYTNSQ